MKRTIRNLVLSLLLLLAATLVCLAAYAVYVLALFGRIPDNTVLEISGETPRQINVEEGGTYRAVTYNVGFGAYSPDYTFFMDEADMLDGTHIAGKYGKGLNRRDVVKNIEGTAAVLRELKGDFILLQEVDIDSDRAFHIDMEKYYRDTFPYMVSIFASNYHSPWLNLPLTDPMGRVEAGLQTLSRFSAESAVRMSYPVPESIAKVFDLDRCFSVLRIPSTDTRELIVINSHISAYDSTGIREKQLAVLFSFIEDEYDKGNWIIIGGDFNHILGEEYITPWSGGEQVPNWVSVLYDEEVPEHFRMLHPETGTTVASAKNNAYPYIKGTTYETIVDGFIVSDNVDAKTYVIDTAFQWSDHQPVVMEFTLL